MSLDTLLKAAQYIELQEKKGLLELSPTPLGDRYQRSQQQPQHFYDNVNNSRSSARHHQVSSSSSPSSLSSSSSSSPSSSSSSSSSSSPPISYVLSNGQMMHNNNNNNSSSSNNNTNSSSQLKHNDFDYGVDAVTSAVAATAVTGRAGECRSITEEPYSNGHSSPSSFVMIQTQQSSTTSTPTKFLQQQQQPQQQQQQGLQTQQHQQQSLSNSPKNEMLSSLFSSNINNNTTITIVENNKNSILSNGGSMMSSNAGSVNLTALSTAAVAVASSSSSSTSQPIVINVTNNRTATNTFNLISHSNNSNLRNSPPMGVASAVAAGNATSSTVFRKKFVPLTPPPTSNRKFVESSRIRSFSLSSNKITSNSIVGSGGMIIGTNNINGSAMLQHCQQALTPSAVEDSSQSSLNLSSPSGYLNGGGNNHSNGGSINFSSTNNLLSGVNIINGSPPRGGNLLVAGGHLDHPMSIASSAPTSTALHQFHGSIGVGNRRRTISSNSNGAGTREVHNKLEKNRRAQLKECFEKLKSQLPLKDEEKKKTSNLAILAAALKHVLDLKKKEQELEQQVEQLAKEKINAQKKIVSLKRELGPKVESIDFSNTVSDIDLSTIQMERVSESLNDSISLSSGRGSMLYSSSSSLSSGSGGNTMSSPLGAGMQITMPNALSPVISQTASSFTSVTSSSNTSPISPNMMVMMKSSSSCSPSSLNVSPSSSLSSSSTSTSPLVLPSTATLSTNISGPGGVGTVTTAGALTVTMPLSLTAKNISATSLTRGSPTPSIPSPSPSSSSGVSSSSSIHSSSPPIGGIKVIPNIPTNGVKFGSVGSTTLTNVSVNGNTFISSPVINITSHNENNGGISSSNSGFNGAVAAMSFNMNNIAVSPSIVGSSNSSTSTSFFSSTPINSVTHLPTSTSVSQVKESNFFNSGRNGLTRKTPSSDGHQHNNSNSNNNNDSSHTNNNTNNNQDKQLDEGEQPAKVFKVFNGISLGSMDKEKLNLSSAPLHLSQVVGGGSLVVSPFLTSSQNGGGLRLVGTNSLATIGTSNGGRCSNLLRQSSSPPNNGGAQLHKLLMSAGGCVPNTVPNVGNSGTPNYISAAELGRLPGGAELNILPTGTNGTTSLYRGNGKLAIVNNGISLKGAGNDTEISSSAGRGIHVVNTPLVQSAGLAPIAGQQGSSFAQLIANSPQLTGKVNLSVGGQNLPLLGTQYLGPMKPVVVAVSNNSHQSTLPPSSSVVPSSSTVSTAFVTGTTNGNAL